MASILCSNCGNGIHYHSEPSGIEYVFLKKEDWDSVCNSKFNPRDKIIENGYPKLFRTDTIEEDFFEKIVKAWKCPECGSVLLFGSDEKLDKYYINEPENESENYLYEGFAFDDYLWDDITEQAEPNVTLKNVMPSFYVRVYANGIAISRNKDFKDVNFLQIANKDA